MFHVIRVPYFPNIFATARMDYLKKYKSFLYSHYFGEGVRITIGVLLPALVLNYFNLLAIGVLLSLGALCVSVTDNPGPIHHRRNGMLVCTGLIFVVSLLTGFIAPFAVLLGVFIIVCCFLFSMLGVYGVRANSIGVAALLVMVLQLGRTQEQSQVLIHAVYILTGGLWYTGLSLLLYSIRPYLLTRQALGENLEATAEYLRIRAAFYDKDVNYEKYYQLMLEQQVKVHHQQDLVRELLYKNRDIAKESTPIGRTLLMQFSTSVDLFERIITAYRDYKELHEAFGDTGILQQYQRLILQVSNELDDIALAIKSGQSSHETNSLETAIKEVWQQFTQLRDERRTPANFDQFHSLRNILENFEDLAGMLHTLHLYTAHDTPAPKPLADPQYDKFITRQDYSVKIFRDNLSIHSNYFRHALRVSLATIAGYILSGMLPIGHGYWILLTIIVILKPAYSLTKKRNYDRVLGTIGGALVGLLILYFIKDSTVLFVIMLLLMVGTYSLLRTNYMISVIMMTPYVLLISHFLFPGPFQTVFTDRLIDTGIGSVIAFAGNFLLAPVWEHTQIRGYIVDAVKENTRYFKDVAAAFTGNKVSVLQYKLSRKNAFVAIANLSDAFTRMLAEPKRKRKNIAVVHELVVANHLLTSHIAALADYAQQWADKYTANEFAAVIRDTSNELDIARALLNKETINIPSTPAISWKMIQERVNTLMEKRRSELQQQLFDSNTRKELFEFKSITDQFTFINRLAADCRKLSTQLGDDGVIVTGNK